MEIRLGYVAIAKGLDKKITSSSTVTFTNYNKIISSEKKLEKLKTVTASNLNALEKIIRYNIEKNIHFYRITSALIPLSTHPEVEYWNYRKIFKRDFEYIGELIKKSNMRVDTHPDQFNVINSTNEDVVKSTTYNLQKHVELFEDINYENGKMVIHVGGATLGKEAGMQRFIKNFNNLPKNIKERLMLENDDKTYTTKETLELCKVLNIPMVLDVHHHNCNNNGEKLEDLLEGVFSTWSKEKILPKFHFSSPKDGELDRRHSDFINSYEFAKFLDLAKTFNKSFDVMLECKEKDLAIFKLKKDLEDKYIWKDESTILIN